MPWDNNGNWVQNSGVQPQGGQVPQGGDWWDQQGLSYQKMQGTAGASGNQYQSMFQGNNAGVDTSLRSAAAVLPQGVATGSGWGTGLFVAQGPSNNASPNGGVTQQRPGIPMVSAVPGGAFSTSMSTAQKNPDPQSQSTNGLALMQAPDGSQKQVPIQDVPRLFQLGARRIS